MKNIDVEIDGNTIGVIALLIMLFTFCILGTIKIIKLDIEKEKTKQLEIQIQMEQKQEV